MKKKAEKASGFLYQGLVLLAVLIGYLGIKIYQTEKMYRLEKILDGDTIVLRGGRVIDLLGVTTNKDEEQTALTKQYLSKLLENKNLWLELDRGGTNRVWLWVGCEKDPKLLASDIRKIFNRQWGANPLGCERGVLANEQLVRMGWSEPVFGKHWGELKYEQRLRRAVGD